MGAEPLGWLPVPESDPGRAPTSVAENVASVHRHQLSLRDRVLRKRKNSFCFARQRKTQQANASKLCPDLRGDSEGFYRFSSEDRLLIRCLYYSPSRDHFRVIESSFSGSSDGFWLSLGLSFLDLLSGMKIACREGVLGSVSITKENARCSITLIRKESLVKKSN